EEGARLLHRVAVLDAVDGDGHDGAFRRTAQDKQTRGGRDKPDGLLAHKSLPMVQDRPAISRSHGAAWNVLISRYIVVMPVSGEACGTQNTSGGPPDSALHSAISAKVGAAASPSQPATPGAEPLPAEAPALWRSIDA